MEGLKVVDDKVNAIILEDVSSGIFTISLECAGGPIISDTDLERAKTSFFEALKLSYSVRNLLTYEKAVKAMDNQKRDIVKSLNKVPEINYLKCSA